jgi:site-specific DNA-methyltransferase (adenine-specific)
MKPYYEDEAVTIYNADCRDVLPTLDTVDLVLTDPPYGITSNEWDIALPASQMLSGFKTVVMTASQPFAAQIICADLERFKHEWIWVKNRGSNFANTVREPFKEHESVLVFSDGQWIYNKQMQRRTGSGADRVKYEVNHHSNSDNYREFKDHTATHPEDRVPSSIQYFNIETEGEHPTRKPLLLFKYLVLTYSDSNHTILDPFMGSGTTLRAAKDLGRKAIGIELEERYCEIAAKRMAQLAMAL